MILSAYFPSFRLSVLSYVVPDNDVFSHANLAKASHSASFLRKMLRVHQA
jgi:hypothetical protein